MLGKPTGSRSSGQSRSDQSGQDGERHSGGRHSGERHSGERHSGGQHHSGEQDHTGERFGVLTIARELKNDGRALILYARAQDEHPISELDEQP
jgi:hypothetical protein